MTDEQIAALRAAAEKLSAMADEEHTPIDAWATASGIFRANSQPHDVLSLLDRLARVEAERDKMREALERALHVRMVRDGDVVDAMRAALEPRA